MHHPRIRIPLHNVTPFDVRLPPNLLTPLLQLLLHHLLSPPRPSNISLPTRCIPYTARRLHMGYQRKPPTSSTRSSLRSLEEEAHLNLAPAVLQRRLKRRSPPRVHPTPPLQHPAFLRPPGRQRKQTRSHQSPHHRSHRTKESGRYPRVPKVPQSHPPIQESSRTLYEWVSFDAAALFRTLSAS